LDKDKSIISLLQKYRQEHLIEDISLLNTDEKDSLLKQLKLIDQFYPCLSFSDKIALEEPLSPFTRCNQRRDADDRLANRAVQEGRIGIILLAGGEGTRLGFSKPKGMFPISVLKNKTLFQIFSEKIFYAQKKYQKRLYLSVMVNPQSKGLIMSFFKENNFFGLQESQVDFFCQQMTPFFTEENKWFWEKKGKIAEGTEGNGGVFYHFCKSPVFKKWQNLNIDTVNILSIDNPLADPFDEKMLALHIKENADVTMCAIVAEKNKKRGGLAYVNGTARVLEYFYLEQKKLPIFFSNTGIYLVRLCYIAKVFEKPLPLHKVKKKTKKWTVEERVSAYKYERFIFDAFAFTDRVSVFHGKKNECFSPLKELKDLEVVKEAMVKKDKKILKELLQFETDKNILEISQEFHYPTEDFLAKWKKNTEKNLFF